MAAIASTESMKAALTATYFQNIPSQYEPMFRAVELAYEKEYPGLRKAVFIANGLQATWGLDKSELKRNIGAIDRDKLEPRIRKSCQCTLRALTKSAALSEIIQKQVTNFEEDRYEDANCPERTKYTNQMKTLHTMISKVHQALEALKPSLLDNGNNLLHVLKTGSELTYRHLDWTCLHYQDVYSLWEAAPLTPAKERRSPSSEGSQETSIPL